MEPTATNPPDEKTVVDGKLHNRVQGLLPLVQHHVQLLRLAYCPVKNRSFHENETLSRPWETQLVVIEYVGEVFTMQKYR